MKPYTYFETAQYEFSHGRKPRGAGGWAFGIKGQTFFFHGTLSECKKQAIAKAIELQTSRIDILP